MTLVVTVKELFERARELDGQRVTVTGLWQSGFERSAFEYAWLEPPRGFRDTEDFENLYVRATGTWRARAGGHFGMWPYQLEADTLVEVPHVPDRVVGPGELAVAVARAPGELVEANVPVRLGHRCFRVDGVALDRIERDPLAPIEGAARVVAWLGLDQHVTVLSWSWVGEPRPSPVPRVDVSALHRHRGDIVEIETPMRAGAYWPVIGADYEPVEVVPPEITTTGLAYLAYGRSEPLPAAVRSWHTRLAAGPVNVRARGTVEEHHFSAYALEVLGPSFSASSSG